MTAPNVRLYDSRPEACFVNSWIVEFTDSLVVVDAQFIVSEANALLARIRALGKPLVALLITRPHPDHFNGAALLKAAFPSLEIIATRKTLDGIESSEGPKRGAWTPVRGDDYPKQTVVPDLIVASGESVRLADTEFACEDVGAGECGSISTIELPAEGRSLASLAQNVEALQRHATIRANYPGHDTKLGLTRSGFAHDAILGFPGAGSHCQSTDHQRRLRHDHCPRPNHMPSLPRSLRRLAGGLPILREPRP